MAVFLVVAPHSLGEITRRFGSVCCPYHQSDNLDDSFPKLLKLFNIPVMKVTSSNWRTLLFDKLCVHIFVLVGGEEESSWRHAYSGRRRRGGIIWWRQLNLPGDGKDQGSSGWSWRHASRQRTRGPDGCRVNCSGVHHKRIAHCKSHNNLRSLK